MKTKDDIIKASAREAGVSLRLAEAVINEALKAIAAQLAAGESIQFRNFGTFEPKKLAGRLTYNPIDGKMRATVERTSVGFRVSNVLRLKVDPNNLTARMRQIKGE